MRLGDDITQVYVSVSHICLCLCHMCVCVVCAFTWWVMMSQCHSVCTFTHQVMMSHADKNTGAVALDYLHRSGKMKMAIIGVTEQIFLVTRDCLEKNFSNRRKSFIAGTS